MKRTGNLLQECFDSVLFDFSPTQKAARGSFQWVDNATLNRCPKPDGVARRLAHGRPQAAAAAETPGGDPESFVGVQTASALEYTRPCGPAQVNTTHCGEGFVAKGGDIVEKNMTLVDAQALCSATPSCVALTFRSNSSDCDGTVCEVMLKNQATYDAAPGWQSWVNERVPRPNPGPSPNSGHGVLYNAMIHPFTPMPVSGFIWFQGESDSAPPNNMTYSCLQRGLIQLWRQAFSSSSNAFFGFVELEPWFKQGSWNDGPPPELRAAQLESTSLPNVGFATATDCGDPLSADGSIHPRQKQLIGERLAAAALTLQYKTPTHYIPPAYRSAKELAAGTGEAMSVAISFSDVPTKLVAAWDICLTEMRAANGTWFSTGLSPRLCAWFTIVGSDGGRYNASAVPNDKQVVLTARADQSGVRAVATSFGWNSWPVNTIMTAEGLPLQPWSETSVHAYEVQAAPMMKVDDTGTTVGNCSTEEITVIEESANISGHLTISSFYGFDAFKMRGWVNLGVEGEGGLQAKLDAWTKYKIPSLYGKLPSSEVPGCADAVGCIFQFGHGLCPGWEASLEALVNSTILPNFGPDKALRGVFVGDELCCRNVTCWQSGLAPVAKKIRALLGPKAIIYTNECGKNFSDLITEVPPDFDLISADIYAGYKPGTNGTDEVAAAKAVYDGIFKKLHGHQKVLLVPGMFGCSDLKYFPLAAQEKNLVDKLNGYFNWAKSDSRIAGFNPWHYSTRKKGHAPPCDMELGPGGPRKESKVLMPSVIAKLEEIGQYIIMGQQQLRAAQSSKTDDAEGSLFSA